MVWSILEKMLGLTWLGDLAVKLNGSKTAIGLVALVVNMLNLVPTYFPQYGISVDISNTIQEVLKWLGIMLPVGVAHKVAKTLAPPVK